MTAICYLNGEFKPLSEATISVLDRGFIFGDGVYEMIPSYAQQAFRLKEHLLRLSDSLAAVQIKNPYKEKQWADLIQQVIFKNGPGHQGIYVQVSRGVAQRDHGFPEAVEPSVLIMSNDIAESQSAQPVSAILLADPRWERCDIKAISLLPNVLLRQQAREKGAYEAILIRDGYLTEGAASNVFIVKQGIVKTPRKGPKLLPGITRDLLVELLQQHKIKCLEVDIPESEVLEADEIWLSSSTKEIVPVTQLGGQQVGTGEPGEIWQKAVAFYQAFKDSFISQSSS